MAAAQHSLRLFRLLRHSEAVPRQISRFQRFSSGPNLQWFQKFANN